MIFKKKFMNIKEFKREISLHKLGISELEGDAQKIYNFLVENLSRLNKYEVYLNNISAFGKTEDIIVLTHSYMLSAVYVEDDMLDFIEVEMCMENREVKELIIWWCELTLDFKPKFVLREECRTLNDIKTTWK